MARRKKRSRKSRSRSFSAYERGVRQADEALARDGTEIRDVNWQEVTLDWFPRGAPEREILARYIAAHEGKLGVRWAREWARMEVFLQAEEYTLVIEHHDRAFSRYPCCGLIEMWVADHVFRSAGDFWRGREMYHRAIEHTPEHPKPYYELGYMNYLLGDFDGAVEWYGRAAERVTKGYGEVAARVFYNRGIIRYFFHGDRRAAMADMKEALRYKRDYVQAREALRALRRRREMRFAPW